MEPIHVLHFYYTRASIVRECIRKRKKYSRLVAFTNKVGGKHLEHFIGRLPFSLKLRFHEFLDLQDSINLMLVFYGLIFVVIEGYQEGKVKDPNIDALLKSDNVDLLRRCRNYVFHFQSDLTSEKLMKFLETPGTETWVQEVFRAFGKFLLSQSEQFFASKY